LRPNSLSPSRSLILLASRMAPTNTCCSYGSCLNVKRN
jgi:hypothetical protein